MGEPPLENGLIPYLGCALKFGANPLEFLRENQRKHGHVFTCKLMGKYVHFVTNSLSYHKVLSHGKYFDWKKFHYTTSAQVSSFAFTQNSTSFLFVIYLSHNSDVLRL
jgi:cholesterol 7alpha-monooxygenase